MEEISRKRKIRGGHRGYVAQLIAQIENENDEIKLEGLKAQLEEKKSLLKQLDEQILDLISIEDDDNGTECMVEVDDAGQLQQRIEASLTKLRKTLNSEEQPPVLSHSPSDSERRSSVFSVDSLATTASTSNIKKVRAKLPKFELKKFS